MLWFISPLIVVTAIPVYVLIASGENFRDIDAVIRRADPCMIGYAYNEVNYDYLKWKALTSREKYSVVALGSSRVLEFRSNMFDSSFYNAGYTIHSLNEFVPFLQSIPREKYPEYLIISLDQWMFNTGWDSLATKPGIGKWSKSFRKFPDENILAHVWEDIFSGKRPFFLSHKKSAVQYIGLNAEYSGFRNDGSCLYARQVGKLLSGDTTAMDYNFSNTLSLIDKGILRFNYGEHVNTKALTELDSLLYYCKTNQMQVIAFLPPFADKVNAKMRATGRYQYMDAIYPLASKIFNKYNYELYDFASLGSVGSNDSETIDGFHGGELTYLKMLIKMLESGSCLNNVADSKKLREQVKQPLNRLAVYKE